MKITFCLPSILKVPAGGFKIVFEYANRLAQRGHSVTIVFLSDTHFVRVKPLFLKKILSYFKLIGYPNWFKLSKKIKIIATPYLDGRDFPKSDIVFATSARTAPIIASLNKEKGIGCYFVQDFENWSMSDEKVVSTYQLGLRVITIAQWLEKLIKEKAGVDAFTISNPIDLDKFFVQKKIEERSPYEIAMLYHEGKHKGVDIAFKALDLVREKYPQIHLNLFGVYEFNKNLSWVSYTHQANDKDLLKIYNRSSIFLCASSIEGFGLTGAESMACGCTLVSTDYQGVFEYAIDQKNALLSPVNDPQKLSDNIIKLIEDSHLRTKLAFRASEDIKSLSWDHAIDKLETFLIETKSGNFM